VIAPGSDADLTLVDPDATWTVHGEELHSVQKHTPLEGIQVRGLPVMTILRGSVVARDRGLVGEPGGCLVRRVAERP
jgi:dihydroorotase-like cyclic amidohydrolase